MTTEMFAEIRRIVKAARTFLIVEQNAYAALGISDYRNVLENAVVALHGETAHLIHDDDLHKTYLGA